MGVLLFMFLHFASYSSKTPRIKESNLPLLLETALQVVKHVVFLVEPLDVVDKVCLNLVEGHPFVLDGDALIDRVAHSASFCGVRKVKAGIVHPLRSHFHGEGSTVSSGVALDGLPHGDTTARRAELCRVAVKEENSAVRVVLNNGLSAKLGPVRAERIAKETTSKGRKRWDHVVLRIGSFEREAEQVFVPPDGTKLLNHREMLRVVDHERQRVGVSLPVDENLSTLLLHFVLKIHPK